MALVVVIAGVFAGVYYQFVTLGCLNDLTFGLTDPVGFAKTEWEHAKTDAWNSFTKLSTLGVTLLALVHRWLPTCFFKVAAAAPDAD